MLGISTASMFARMPLEGLVEKIAQMEYPVCEIFLNSFSEYEPSFIDKLVEVQQRTGIKVRSIHPMGTQFEPQLYSRYHVQFDDALSCYHKVLDAAKRLGAQYYVMHGPLILMGAFRRSSFKRLGEVTSRILDIAQEKGIAVAWENVSWCLLREPETIIEMREATADHSNLFFTLDTKQALRSNRQIEEYIAAMEGKIANVHICDVEMTQDGAVSKMLGQGDIDFRKLKVQLDNAGYTGPVMVEVYSDLYDELDALDEVYKEYSQIF